MRCVRNSTVGGDEVEKVCISGNDVGKMRWKGVD